MNRRLRGIAKIGGMKGLLAPKSRLGAKAPFVTALENKKKI
jgi:hypothetical protein